MKKFQIRRRIYFTQKQWKKFDYLKQQHLTRYYEIILSDYLTKKERTVKILKSFNIKNFNRGLETFNHMIDSFLKPLDSFHNTMNAQSPRHSMEFWGRPSDLEEYYTDKRPNIKNVVWGKKRTNLF